MSLQENDFIEKLKEIAGYRFELGIFFEDGRKIIFLDEDHENEMTAADALYIDEHGSPIRGIPSRRSLTSAFTYLKNEVRIAFDKSTAKDLEFNMKEVAMKVEKRLSTMVNKQLRSKIRCKLFKNDKIIR